MPLVFSVARGSGPPGDRLRGEESERSSARADGRGAEDAGSALDEREHRRLHMRVLLFSLGRAGAGRRARGIVLVMKIRAMFHRTSLDVGQPSTGWRDNTADCTRQRVKT